jgi:hypothetical protein
MSKIVRQNKEFSKIPSKNTQRAVIFQGGGAIGAYAAGVYAVLYHWVKKADNVCHSFSLSKSYRPFK